MFEKYNLYHDYPMISQVSTLVGGVRGGLLACIQVEASDSNKYSPLVLPQFSILSSTLKPQIAFTILISALYFKKPHEFC